VTKATTRRFFFIGTVIFTLTFIGLTVQTHRDLAARTHTDKMDAAVVRGNRAWERYNCENCHTLLGEGAYYAPDLTQIVQQRGRPYLEQFLADPSRFYSEKRDGRLMPTLGMRPEEISDVISFLDWVGHIDTNGWPPRPIMVSGVAIRGMPGVSGSEAAPEPSIRGKALFNGAAACATCHSIAPGTVLVGPSLAGIAVRAGERIREPGYHGEAKTAQGYLRESILHPSAFIAPGGNFATAQGVSFMLATYSETLKPGQVDDLVAYLMTLH
jgi:nitric oxide reductase subunit C